MNDFKLGDKVRVTNGKYKGYYGVIVDFFSMGARVTHSNDFVGHAILFEDLEAD